MTDATNLNAASEGNQPERRWRPLDRFQRRVLGTLAEKAKTTPDGYPMTISGITTGCNQKSNRSPQMNMTQEQTESALQELRGMGAVTEVYGSGRVSKFRHHFYEWLDVRGAEAAVMIELMLRGEQTVGELRSRAARFDESIADLAALKPVLEALQAKGLVISLTPEGRGQMVSHNLYREQELDAIRRAIASGAYAEPAAESAATSAPARDDLKGQLAELKSRLERIERHLGIDPNGAG